MGTQPPALVPVLALCMLMVPCAFAIVAEKMGNITFECPDGWKVDGPDCYLLVDVAMTYEDALEMCGKYGSDLVHIRDEVEATAVGMMAHDRAMSDWKLYWIANRQTDAEGVCGGFWDVGQPKDVNVSTPFYVAATAPLGRWQERDKSSRLPFVCRTEACVEGTFRCRDGKKCISNKWLCDGEYDCDDQSDESACDSKCMYYKYESSGTLDQNTNYDAGSTCTWVIEGTEPGKPISIQFASVNVEADVDYVEVWTGGPSLMTSKLQERLTGSLTNKKVYGYNNFIIIRRVAGLSASGTGFVATWAPDDELSHMERPVVATDTWTELTSPHNGSDPLPCSFVRHYTVTTEEGSLITMEVMENELGEGFEYDPKTLSLLGDFGIFPDTYVSRSNMFSFYLVSNGCEGPEKFKARVKKGCSADFSRANSFVASPNAPPLHYPPSVMCTYTIRAPPGEQRAFQLRFTMSELADEKDSVKVYDGADNSSTELTPAGGYTGSSQAPNATFISTGSVVFVVFTSSLVQTNGFFYLSYNLACPAITNSDNMQMSSNDTHYDSEVTLSCNTGYAFVQEEFASVTEVDIRCGLQGKWNVSRLPSCKIIYCGVPEAIPNGFISEGSGNAQYNDTVTYQCFQGFTMTGSNTSTCGDRSMWSPRPTCAASQCPALDPLANGETPTVTGSGTGFGTITNYTCADGFDLVGSRYTLCQTNGNWSHPAPTCERIKCPIPDVHRAVLSPTDPVDFQSTLTVTCNAGFVIKETSDESKAFPCLSSGTFDFRRDVCVDKDECDGSPCTGEHQKCQNTMGSYTCGCEDKYKKNAKGACEVIDRCADKTSGCDSMRGYCNASVSKEDFTCGCKPGYTLFTSDDMSGRRILSPEDGMTPGDVYYLNHTCVPKTCGPPPDVSNAQKLTNRTTYDFQDTVEYRCNFGYSIQGTNPLTCNENGQWDNPPPSCKINACEPLAATGLVLNIYPNSTTNPGDTVVLECNSDATDVPYNKTLFCEYDKGTDSFILRGDNPHCPAVDCGDLNPMGGATFTVTEKGLGATFMFACQGGFGLEGMSTMGNTEVTCQKNGRWGLGNLTCNGERCMDPGTPGGMVQESAYFEVGGVVVYICSREGFMPDPMSRTCEYNTTSSSVYWDSSEPVCKDMVAPSFTNCPTETIFVKPYQNASSEMTMGPSAQDNSGLVTMEVMPAWFSLDVPLPPGQYNVTYTASDATPNSAACDFTIEVNDPSVLPMLSCPDYLTLEVNDSMSYDVNLKDHVSTDIGVMLSYAPAEHDVVTVGPNTVGKTPVRVTATDKFGFQQQCAFIVDIKPNKCLESFISSGLQNATKSCTGAGGGNLSCTVTCNSGYAFQSGATSMPYSCSGANEWSPSLPVEACVVTVVPEYTFEVMVRYGGLRNLQKCAIETKLREHIPTQEILCFYQLSNGTNTQMTFRVTNVEFFGINFDYLFANVSLGLNVDPPPTETSDLVSCAARMQASANIQNMFSLTGVTCPAPTDTKDFPAVNPTLVNNGQSCGAGRTLMKVDSVDKCVQCAPGNFYQESGASCEVCLDGEYQSEAGQTKCDACSHGGQYSAQPRSSPDQCIAPCPLGFFNGVGQTEDADVECIACPVDQYLDTWFAANCTQCQSDTTTSGVEGATDVGACIDKCGPGMYPVNNTQCAPCPRGYYKPSPGNEKCEACDKAKTTPGFGSKLESDCVNVTLAQCQNGGTARADYHKGFCECHPGYTGDTCEDIVDACDSNPCYNNGACTSTGPNTFSCECQSDKKCEMVPVDIAYIAGKHTFLLENSSVDQETCKRLCIDRTDCAVAMYYASADSTSCQLFIATEYTNGTRLPGWDTFLKSCAKTFLFEGRQCEKDLTDDCTNATCADISFCRDMVDSADCVCPSDSKYTEPSCDIDETVCDPNPCSNGGTCEDSGSGVRATCVCPAGFTGSKCEVDIDECAENPDGCLYGGNCTQAVNMYSCQCGDYSGDHCEIKPNFCTDNPTFCQNGLCYNDYNISSLVCVCEFPYKLGTGGQCEEIDICMEDNPCLNNSTCNKASPGVTSCQCMDGYTGSRCQHNIDDCASMPCTNGTCMDLVNNYTCQCDSGFTLNGINCVNIDDCGNCTSANTETCVDLVNDYRCVCKVGFKGKDCEMNIDECMSMPCQHNGSCTQSSTPGQYNCSCVDGWTGHNCEKLDEFCTAVPCQSGGKCYSLQDDYFCECEGGSSGRNCEESSNVCSILNPCTPSITCQDADGTAKCQCPTSYTGSSCNLIEDSCSNSPCQNGGTCMLNNLGHTCQCAEGFSDTNCTTASSACDSVTCPSGITCVEVMKEAVCLCGAQQLKSGDSCKDASNNFDMYFARRGKAVRSIQPVKLTKDVLTVMFWLAPMVNTSEAPIQLKQSTGTNVLSVFRASVMFGDGASVDFKSVTGDSEKSFDNNTWNQFSATWNATSYELYMNGIRLRGGTHDIAFPPQNEFMFIYIGEDFEGYVSQLAVWERRVDFDEVLIMYDAPKTPSTEDLLLGWSGYRLMDNLWARVITPSSVDTGSTVCEPGRSPDCNTIRPDTDPLTVPNCPGDKDETTSRLVQVNDLFAGQDLMSNIDGTLLTFGAHRLVFLKKDSHGNTGVCRFTAYVRREDKGRAQSCAVIDGLTSIKSCGSGNKGRKVQCSPGSVAPLSPKVLTCGKLGSYNLHNRDRRPAAIVCGATSSFKYKVTMTLRYQVSVDCSSQAEQDVREALQEKVKALGAAWLGLCPDTNCDNADTSDVKCMSSGSRMVVVKIVLKNVPATLTKGSTTLTAKELLETATKEFTTSAFAIPSVFNAQLMNDAVIDAEPTCDAGQGLHDGVCVVCAAGSFLNETSEMCQLCPIGSYTNSEKQIQCTQCPNGQTTLQLGADDVTDCVVECEAGTSYNRDNSKCDPCPKNFYNNKTGQEYCTPCPAGKATETEGATMLGLCFDTCPAGTQLNGSDCDPCPRGMYSDGVQHENCVSCPVGNTTANTGSTSLSSCYQTACEAGNYRDSDTNTCMECDYGLYQPEKWQDMCLQCNNSYTTENKASTSAEQCMFLCEAGNENLSGTMCTPCKKGLYRDGSMEQRFMNCTACNATFTTDGEGSDSADDCKIRICNAGSYRNETDNECYPCPMGEYQPDSLQTACLACPRNLTTKQESSDNMTQCVFYCAEGYEVMPADSETCQACARGKYKTNDGVAKFGMCESCTPKNFTDDEASVSAANCSIPACDAGQKIMGDVCLNCPVNTYQPMDKPKSSTDCMACGAGTGTKEEKRTLSTDCEPVCDAGYQYNMAMMSCQLCPLGTFNTGNDTQRFEQCEACPAGYVTVNEMTGATSIDNCTLRDCPAGQFISGSDCLLCPVGTYQNISRQDSCKDCRENTNTSGKGKAEASECTISCDAGKEQALDGSESCITCREDRVKAVPGPGTCDECTGNVTANVARTDCDVLFCDKGFKYNATGPTCDPCEMGTYKAMRGKATECMECPTNTTTARVASTSEGDCNQANCDKGFYSPNAALPCQACPVGKYKAVIGNAACTDCSPGLTTAGVASTGDSQCSLNVCPVGQYRDMANQCVNCSMGFYQNETGQTECMMCPTGYTTVGTGADDQDDCKIVCSAGSYRNDTTNMCEQCPMGQYQESEGQTECSMCPADYTTNATGSNSSTDCYVICPSGSAATARDSCEKCPHGEYQSADNANACKACDSGYTTLQTGSTSEEQCQPVCSSGQYLNMTSRMCMPCPLGTYNGEAGTNTTVVVQCTACPEGNTTSNTGAETMSSCNIPDCLAGFFRSSNGGCQECEVGTYQAEKSQTSCIPCDGDNTTLLPGRDDSKYCVLTCPDGKAYMQASGTCEDCKIGFYRKASPSDTDCIKCPAGETTITQGKESCVPVAQGAEPAVRVVKIAVRVKIRLRIKPCGTSVFNKEQLGNIITNFILKTLEILDMRFPAICAASGTKNCVNVKITFKVGCLQNFPSRRKRATDPEEQEVDIEVEGVDSEVEDNATKAIHDPSVAIERAFYDSQAQEKELEDNQIEFLGVDNVTAAYQPVSGQGPLKSDGTPAGSVDLVSPSASGFTYGPCPNGTYSNDGAECVMCEVNTYQDQTGQTSCKNCPGKTFTSTGAKAESQCRKKCDEQGADDTYCSGRGSCSYDSATSDGVRCLCKEGFGGSNCNSRQAPTSDKTTMVAGIAGGAGAFLVLLIIIVGIAACLRHKAKKGKNGKKESSEGTESKQIYDNEAYVDYGHPMFASPTSHALPGQPSIMYYNPETYDQEVRDFYRTGRSSGPPSRYSY